MTRVVAASDLHGSSIALSYVCGVARENKAVGEARSTDQF